MFFVLKELITALLHALALSCGIAFLIGIITRVTHSRYDFINVKPILILAATIVLLFLEGVFLFGAVRIRRQIDSTWGDVTLMINQVQAAGQNLNEEQLLSLIEEQIPGIGAFISAGEEGANTAARTAAAYYEELRGEVGWYIWKRIFWILGFTLVGGYLMVDDAVKQSRRSRSYAAYLSEY